MKKAVSAAIAAALVLLMIGLGVVSMSLGKIVKSAVEAAGPRVLGVPVTLGLVTLFCFRQEPCVEAVIVLKPVREPARASDVEAGGRRELELRDFYERAIAWIFMRCRDGWLDLKRDNCVDLELAATFPEGNRKRAFDDVGFHEILRSVAICMFFSALRAVTFTSEPL